MNLWVLFKSFINCNLYNGFRCFDGKTACRPFPLKIPVRNEYVYITLLILGSIIIGLIVQPWITLAAIGITYAFVNSLQFCGITNYLNRGTTKIIAMKKILVLNGPNLNLLHKRDCKFMAKFR